MKTLRRFSPLLFTIFFFAFGISAQTRQKAELVVQLGHSNIVGATAFSPDGRFIVTGDGFAKVLILWETASGRELRRFVGHDDAIVAVAFSHNGQFVASISKDKSLRKWEITTGRELLNINLARQNGRIDDDEPLDVLAFGANDLTLITSAKTSISKSDFPQEQSLYRHTSFADSPVSVENPSLQLWSAVDGALLKDERLLEPLAVSADGKLALVWQTTSPGKDATLLGHYSIWDLATHRPLSQLKSNNGVLPHGSIESADFLPDGRAVSTILNDKSESSESIDTRISYTNFGGSSKPRLGGFDVVVVWDALTGQPKKRFGSIASSAQSTLVQKGNAKQDHYVLYSSCPVSEKNRAQAGLSSICSLDLETGEKTETRLERFLGYSNQVMSVAASPDGRFVAFGTLDSTTTIINVADNEIVSWLTGKMPYVADVSISADGASISTIAEDETKMRWDLTTGQPVVEKKGSGKGRGIYQNDIDVVSPGGKLRVTRNKDHLTLQRAATNEAVFSFEHADFANSAAFSPDNLLVAVGYVNGKIRLWSVVTGKIVETLDGHTAIVYSAAFMPDGKTLVTGSMDATTRLWNIETAKEKARLITTFDGSWTVITPEGLFDASPEARKLMHFVVGLEIVTLEQTKDIYYVPGLLSKIFKGEPLPKVELFSNKDLFPVVEFSPPRAGQNDLTIKVVNRGGGIGQVQVLVNGKEFINDARPANFDASTKEITLTVSLKDAPLAAGRENKIEVVARNAAGSLTNRGTARGLQLVRSASDQKPTETPHVYAIVGGISNYTGDNLKLNFAAKDAEDFAKALELGATKLVGGKNNVHIRLLTSNGDQSTVKFNVPDAKISTATKADFERAFADFKNATPNDVFIVYLAGHGVTLNLNQNPNQAGGDTYLYLTQEATTTDKSVLVVEQSRRAMTVSSDELKNLMKQNKALKQVLILDTCASGQAAQSFVQKRDLPSDQIRAIERLKDNTGFYILMGSAADSASYEASQYGQGLLTYSLLQGMKGAKLRENQFADVGLLFEYAQEVVPQMAKNIGGIQQPRSITPDTSRSFDIGMFTPDEQKLISLSTPKPVILRPSLRNASLRFDNLKLTQMMTEQLRRIGYVQARGEQSRIVFVEVNEMTDAAQPIGDYTIEGDTLKMTVILVKNNAPLGEEITVTGKASEAEKVVKQLIEAVMQSLY